METKFRSTLTPQLSKEVKTFENTMAPLLLSRQKQNSVLSAPRPKRHRKMLHSPVYVRLRPSEEDHLVRPHDSEQLGLTVNDEFFFDSTSVLVNSSQEDTFRTIGVPLVDETLKGWVCGLLTRRL